MKTESTGKEDWRGSPRQKSADLLDSFEVSSVLGVQSKLLPEPAGSLPPFPQEERHAYFPPSREHDGVTAHGGRRGSSIHLGFRRPRRNEPKHAGLSRPRCRR